jgi:hypothetical protein
VRYVSRLRRRLRGKGIFVLGCAIFFVVGLGISIYAGCEMYKSMQSNSWLAADGIIKTAALNAKPAQKRVYYSAKITYEYSVEGKRLIGDQIRMVNVETSNPSNCEQDLDKYPVGAKIRVYYSPTDPSDCVLEPGVQTDSWGLAGMGGAFVVFSSLGIAASYFLRN